MELKVIFDIDEFSILNIYVELDPCYKLKINCRRNIHKTKFTKDLVIRYIKRDYNLLYITDEPFYFSFYGYNKITDPEKRLSLSFGDLKQALVKKNYTMWKQIEKIIFSNKSSVALPQKNSGFIDPHKYWKKK